MKYCADVNQKNNLSLSPVTIMTVGTKKLGKQLTYNEKYTNLKILYFFTYVLTFTNLCIYVHIFVLELIIMGG